MTIEPDAKDWTWVLEKPCPECGFDATAIPRGGIGAAVRSATAGWPAVLRRPGVRDRPDPSTWSPLEYACHVRDACRIFAGRLELMLTQDDPVFANWDQDATAVRERYGDQDPASVAAELAVAADAVAAAFAAVENGQWQRTGRRSNGSVFTVESLGRYFLHDPVHHRHDVGG
jgi:hypothetical protein